MVHHMDSSIGFGHRVHVGSLTAFCKQKILWAKEGFSPIHCVIPIAMQHGSMLASGAAALAKPSRV
jgi:hypothetical protein